MSASLNKVLIIGNCVADPEIRRLASGSPVANLRVATNETWRDKASGERREKSEYHSVIVFNEGLCKVVEQYVKKGAKLYIEGQLQTRKWQDRDGQDRYSTEVVLQGFNSTLTMLDSNGKSDDRDDGRREAAREKPQDSYGNQQSANFSSDLDDIPFAAEFR